MQKWITCALLILTCSSAASSLWAVKQVTDSAGFFESQVRPILANNCYRCHTGLQSGGLRVDSRENLLKGGHSGPAIVPGNPEASLLIRAVRQISPNLKMPLGGKLKDQEVNDLIQWVAMGTPWPEPALDVKKEVVALLQARCVKCHGGEKPQAGLDLASLEAVNRANRSVVVPGKLDASPLWQAIQQERMPPGEPLAGPERALLRRWIEQGAPGLVTTVQVHWAFRSPQRPSIPRVLHPEGVRTSIDTFLLAALEQKGLSFRPEADRATLVRRISFDLTGLPPTPADIETFVRDQEPDAYKRMVERYLASAQYGERWGRHWLDLAGYADSNGFFTSDSDRPLAYKYRDYVVRAFNEDKPFDRFIQEQIAGDELAGFGPESDVTPEMAALLTATHFLRNAPDGTGESDGNPEELASDRYAVIEGNLQILGSALLGVTLQCARCHNHKFEPITQQEYYQLQAVFKSAYNHDRWLKPNERVQCVGTHADCEANRQQIQAFDRDLKATKESLEGLTKPFRELVLEENLRQLPEDIRIGIRAALDTPEKRRLEEMKLLLKQHESLVQIQGEQLARRFPELSAGYRSLTEAIKKKEEQKPTSLPQVAALTDVTPNPPPHHLLARGNYSNPVRPVEPGVPSVFCTGNNVFQVSILPGQKSSGRRLAFARWLTSPEHPSLARLMVNRIWLHHFGHGLVATPNNFGVSGSQPTHPELLDYLATEFVRSGWSVKAIHRLILMSAAYRQASAMNDRAYELDPENHLLWRYSLRRLEAEAIRDAMLFISGELELKLGGPYTPTRRDKDGQVSVEETAPDARRRSLYLQQRRTQVVSVMEVFDAPDMIPNCPRRGSSTVSLQSLALLNSDFVRARSNTFADRLTQSIPHDAKTRLTLAFELAYGRKPRSSEQAAAEEFLRSQHAYYSGKPDAEKRVWADLCQMLLAGNNFLYVE